MLKEKKHRKQQEASATQAGDAQPQAADDDQPSAVTLRTEVTLPDTELEFEGDDDTLQDDPPDDEPSQVDAEAADDDTQHAKEAGDAGDASTQITPQAAVVSDSGKASETSTQTTPPLTATTDSPQPGCSSWTTPTPATLKKAKRRLNPTDIAMFGSPQNPAIMTVQQSENKRGREARREAKPKIPPERRSERLKTATTVPAPPPLTPITSSTPITAAAALRSTPMIELSPLKLPLPVTTVSSPPPAAPANAAIISPNTATAACLTVSRPSSPTPQATTDKPAELRLPTIKDGDILTATATYTAKYQSHVGVMLRGCLIQINRILDDVGRLVPPKTASIRIVSAAPHDDTVPFKCIVTLRSHDKQELLDVSATADHVAQKLTVSLKGAGLPPQ